MGSRSLVCGAAVLLAALTASPRGASAQSSDAQALRTELLQIAERSRAGGDHQRALDAALRAQQLQSSASLELFIATEQTALGHHARAYENALACVRSAGAPGTRNGEVIRAQCQGIATAARPRLAQVVVEPARPAPAGLVIRVNGEVIDPALYGVSYFVDPGTVRVEASASGRGPWSRAFDLAAGQAQTVVPEPVADAPRADPAETPRATERADAASRPSVRREVRSSPLRAVSYAGFALGAASAIAGVGLLAAREGAVGDYNARFDRGECAGADLRGQDPCADVANRADLFRPLGTSLVVVGGVFAAVSIGLFVAGAPRVVETNSATECGVRGAGVGCRLVF